MNGAMPSDAIKGTVPIMVEGCTSWSVTNAGTGLAFPGVCDLPQSINDWRFARGEDEGGDRRLQ